MTITTRLATAALSGLLLAATPAAAQAQPQYQPRATTQTQNPTALPITAADRQEGAKAHRQLLAEYGGPYSGPQVPYIESIGKNIAVQSALGSAKTDFTVTVLNSPVENAFANPGGYIYLTRQLAALANNEAELAAVLGHEVGHVAARHSAKRQSAAQRNSIIGAIGSILSGVVLGNTGLGQLGQQLFSSGSQLLTLKFSRAQESEADQLAVTYLKRAGYDPTALGAILQRLAAQNALDAQLQGISDSTPTWASTHPEPAARVRTALALAGQARGITNRDAYLARIDGLMYGDDPRQGMVEGRTFTHPEMKLTFTAPAGSFLANGTQAVSIGGQNGQGQFTSAPFSGDLDAYVRAVFGKLSSQAQLAPTQIERTTVNGIPAAYGQARVTTSDGPVDVTVFAYAFAQGQAYHFVTIAPAGRGGAFDPMYRSLRRISTTEASQIRPRRLRIVTVKAGDTVRTLAARMAYTDAPLQRFLVLNGLTETTRLPTGTKVKLVTY